MGDAEPKRGGALSGVPRPPYQCCRNTDPGATHPDSGPPGSVPYSYGSPRSREDPLSAATSFLLAADGSFSYNVHSTLHPLLEAIIPKALLHILATDFLTLGTPTDRHQNLLVITDLFTKYSWAVPTADQMALTTVRALWRHVF